MALRHHPATCRHGPVGAEDQQLTPGPRGNPADLRLDLQPPRLRRVRTVAAAPGRKLLPWTAVA